MFVSIRLQASIGLFAFSIDQVRQAASSSTGLHDNPFF